MQCSLCCSLWEGEGVPRDFLSHANGRATFLIRFWAPTLGRTLGPVEHCLYFRDFNFTSPAGPSGSWALSASHENGLPHFPRVWTAGGWQMNRLELLLAGGGGCCITWHHLGTRPERTPTPSICLRILVIFPVGFKGDQFLDWSLFLLFSSSFFFHVFFSLFFSFLVFLPGGLGK